PRARRQERIGRADDHPRSQSRRAIRRLIAVAQRRQCSRIRRSGRRADARHGRARVRLACRASDRRRPSSHGPAPSIQGIPRMNVALLVLALVQQPRDTIVLNPAVVTATRVPMPSDVLSSAVTVLRGTDLVAEGIRTVADALQQVPGATIVETGSFGGQTSLFMRGGESDYVKVLLDGVPLNQAGGGIDLANITTDNVDRIEILRGPASVLYGSDAMTGVVQIFTRTGEGQTPRVGAELQAGTYSSLDGALDLAGGTTIAGYAVRVSRFSSDGLYPYNNEYRNTVVSARTTVRPDARTALSRTD